MGIGTATKHLSVPRNLLLIKDSCRFQAIFLHSLTHSFIPLFIHLFLLHLFVYPFLLLATLSFAQSAELDNGSRVEAVSGHPLRLVGFRMVKYCLVFLCFWPDTWIVSHSMNFPGVENFGI